MSFHRTLSAPNAVIPQSGSEVIQEQMVTRYAGSSSATFGQIYVRPKIVALNDTREFFGLQSVSYQRSSLCCVGRSGITSGSAADVYGMTALRRYVKLNSEL